MIKWKFMWGQPAWDRGGEPAENRVTAETRS